MAPIIRFKPLGLGYVEAFTEAHRIASDKYEREQKCLNVQFPASLVAPRSSDWLAGKRTYPEVGYSVQYGGMGFYADFFCWPTADDPKGYDADELARWESLRAYWMDVDATQHCRVRYEPEYAEWLKGMFTGVGVYDEAAYPLYRMAGLQLDLRKMVMLGLDGLEQKVTQKSEWTCDDEACSFFQTCRHSIQVFRDAIAHYIYAARQLPQDPKRDAMLQVLEAILHEPPQTFHQALQLVMLSSTMTGTINFGRMDVVLGDFLCRDLDTGTLTWDHAKELLANFYVLVEEEIMQWDGRIIVGGRGRENEEMGDRFAMLAMEVTDSLCLPMPQLSLRFYEGQNPELQDKAYDVIAHGKTFPMLYNDEVNIPAVISAFGVDETTAEQYLPYGCGEYMIYHQSCHTPNGIINLMKCLEATLNNGQSFRTGAAIAPDVGNLNDYDTFEALWDAYDKTVSFLCKALGHAQDITYKVMGETAPFGFVSLLYDDCLERGRPIFGVGIHLLGGTCETYGNTNCADSLTAMQQCIYGSGSWTREALLRALRDDWHGHERMQRDFRKAPKYGNDDEVADAMFLRVHDHVCQRTKEGAEGTSLAHYLVVVINNKINTVWGAATSASPDSRVAGEALAPGNAPGGGRDVSGLTAVLNSQAKPDAHIHAGAAQNVKLNVALPNEYPDLYRAIFQTYFQQGGAQIMITVTNRADLEAALREPEKYPHLLVRVGGFSARFIDLDPATQQEILSRTEHGI